MAKGKRMLDNHSNRSTHRRFKEEKKFSFKKIFTIFLIILVLAGLVYVAYRYIPVYISKNISENSGFNSISSTNIGETKVVEGLEYVSITSINISTSDKDSSIIEIHFKNNSSNDIEENRSHFYALNAEGNIIFGMPLTIPKLTANSETIYKVLCTNNLSEAKDYEISLEDK